MMIEIWQICIIFVMTFMGATASLFLKKGSSFNSFKELITNKNLYIGGIIYVLSALVNIWILKYLDYSTVLPLTSITYIWTMLLSHFVLKEKIGKKKIAGVTLILVGAVLIALK